MKTISRGVRTCRLGLWDKGEEQRLGRWLLEKVVGGRKKKQGGWISRGLESGCMVDGGHEERGVLVSDNVGESWIPRVGRKMYGFMPRCTHLIFISTGAMVYASWNPYTLKSQLRAGWVLVCVYHQHATPHPLKRSENLLPGSLSERMFLNP